MVDPHPAAVESVVVEEEVRFTLEDLCRACRVGRSDVIVLVEEGVLEPAGAGPEDWLFGGPSLSRARLAVRLAQDLELGAAGTAIVLDLLDQIESLRSQLRRAGVR